MHSSSDTDAPRNVLVVSHEAGSKLADRLPAGSRVTWLRTRPEDVDAELTRLLPRGTAERLAVLGIGGSAGAAVRAAADHGDVAALALVGPRLDETDVDLLAEWPELPVLGVADPTHRPGLRGAVDAYLASTNGESRLRVGAVDGEALQATADWLADRLARTARVEEVTFEGEDGWLLHATVRIPRRDGPVPAAVLLHTGRSDRAAYARLERLLPDAGVAVCALDWRGRGQSTNNGSYFDLDTDTRAKAWQDALAALDHLAARPEIDADRLATVGVVHGAEFAVRAAHRDQRVKAVVILTGYRPQEPEEGPHLTSGHINVLYVASRDHTITTEAMRKLHDATPAGRSAWVEYPGAAIGYQLFELDPSLEPRVATWLGEVLAA